MKFLLVDDSDFSLSMTQVLICRALDNENIDFILAKDGVEAIKIFANSEVGEISAIFMDIVMREKTGLIALREIRSMERSDATTVPSVIVSALSEDNSVEGTEDKKWITDYIQKPIGVAKFKNTFAKRFQSF